MKTMFASEEPKQFVYRDCKTNFLMKVLKMT